MFKYYILLYISTKKRKNMKGHQGHQIKRRGQKDKNNTNTHTRTHTHSL